MWISGGWLEKIESDLIDDGSRLFTLARINRFSPRYMRWIEEAEWVYLMASGMDVSPLRACNTGKVVDHL